MPKQLRVSSSCPASALVLDNGPQFCSEEFATFLKANGVRHIRCAPYHPASNGLVERFMRTFKQALKARESSGLPLQHCLASILFGYWTTPHATTGCSLSVLFLGRELRTHLDLLRPICEDHVVPSSSTKCSIMTSMPNVSSFRLDSG